MCIYLLIINVLFNLNLLKLIRQSDKKSLLFLLYPEPCLIGDEGAIVRLFWII